ncbi:hypothetical protein N7527_005119 [Penicillium freii]|nr:hypothetical protein N7527_005119 [Penicillium freii]
MPSDNVSSAYNPESRPSTKRIHLFIVTDLKWISVEFHGGGVFGIDVRLRERYLPNRDAISRDHVPTEPCLHRSDEQQIWKIMTRWASG